MADQPLPAGPCREWLGLEPDDLANARRVLGVLPRETDPRVVLEAAKARIRLLRTIDAGPLEAVRHALLERVERAREEVLDAIAAARGDGVSDTPARRRSFAMPPPPPGVVPPRRDDPESAIPSIRLRAGPPPRRSGTPALAVIGLSSLVALAAVLGWITWQRGMPARERRDVARHDVPGRGAPARTADGDRSRPAPAAPAEPAVPSPPASEPSGAPATGRQPPPAPERGAGSAALAAAAAPDDSHPVASAPAPDRLPAAEPPPQLPGPSATPSPADASTRVDGSVADALLEPLQAVRRAMAGRDFDAAGARLRTAAAASSGADAVARVEAWRQLLHYARGFADYRDTALGTVAPGQEYDVDGKKIAVVEIDDETFIYRYAGRNTSVRRDRIPGGILMAIVTTWFDAKPENQLFIGAYHATKPEPDPTKARACWEAASAAGIDASHLLGLLDDPALAPVEPAP